MSELGDGHTYCAELVSEHQPGRYLATLFAPASVRGALFALYAFDHELAKVHRLISEPMAGLIRFQWWRDALGAISRGEAAPAHPIAQALQHEWHSVGPSRPLLDTAIDARERELDQEPLESMTAFEGHIQATSAGLVLAGLGILAARQDKAHEVGHRVGLALGITDFLSELDQRRERACLLPEDLLRSQGVSTTTVREATSPQDFAPVVRGLAEDALEHLRQARRLQRGVSRQELPALLPAALVSGRLKGLRALRGRSAGKPQSLAALRLLVCWALGRF